MRVVFRRAARNDLWRLIDWLEQQSPAAARRADTEIKAGLRSLSEHPHSGMAVGDHWREKPIRFGAHGFVVRYLIATDRIEVIRVFHTAQDRTDRD